MAKSSSSKTWLITGASQGLGLAIALSALKKGHKVIAGARNPEVAGTNHPELTAAGGEWLHLDVSLPSTRDIVQQAAEKAGGIDVVVNNAGYYAVGQIEDFSEEEMKDAMETNFWGPVRVVQGALPGMRARKSGTIVSISSILGFYPCPAGVLYSCPKAAQDMLQSVLKSELAVFNIRTITITAGLYRTGVITASKLPAAGITEDYLAGSVGKCLQDSGKFAQDASDIPGDPEKFGERIVEVVDSTGLASGLEKTSRFLFGKDAIQLSKLRMAELAEDFKNSEDIAASTDFEGHTGRGVLSISDYL
ncbi:hypothetical protein LTR84_000951 [Exophiala bonariae]|uniref:NAD(P)-binding protein n=1 Tax=Exophiala bonariae TaxID=1690606 RepID=A0AAV9NW04_9EURO|nr:hypothetical protein LTR84_000951 [Exophiala bonariae]